MEPSNKLLLPFDGTTVVEKVIRNLREAGFARSVVVTGYDRNAVAEAVEPYGVQVIQNPDFSEGMATSIRAGVEGAAGAEAGYLICLGDMPLIQPTTYQQVVQRCVTSTSIVQPIYRGQPGHPVAFGNAYGDELRQLVGDRGARSVLRQHEDAVTHMPVDDPGILLDVDTPERYAEAMAYAASFTTD